MKNRWCLFVFFTGISLLKILNLPAQEYLDLWRNGKTDNFYLIQKKFKEYHAGREPDRDGSDGEFEDGDYSKFKRWEFIIEPRVYPSGKLINHARRALDEDTRYRSRSLQLQDEHNGNWQSLGIKYYTDDNQFSFDRGGMGRVNCILPHPADQQILFAGTPAGGLWKTTDAGKNWMPLTDGLPVIGVSGIAVNPQNPDSIYILTGDGDGGNTSCTGVLLSANGGDTWQSTGLQFDVSTNVRGYKLLMHPVNPKILFAATNYGIYKTTDGGVTWSRKIAEFFTDLTFSPNDHTTLYAAAENSLYLSHDSGDSWYIDIHSHAWLEGASRIAIAVNSKYIYLLAGSTTGFLGLFRSHIDPPFHYNLQSNSPNILGLMVFPPYDKFSQAYYDLAIAVSPDNAEEVHIGGINCWKSLDGGETWINTSSYRPIPYVDGYTHGDIHALVFYGNTLYCGSDGGVFRTTDHAAHWEDISYGLEITQFYDIASPPDDPATLYGGTQDNGLNKWTAPETTMSHQLGGDVVACMLDYTDKNIIYALLENSRRLYYKAYGGVWRKSAPPILATASWAPPLIMHPTDHTVLYAGYNAIYAISLNSLGIGITFKQQSPFFVTEGGLVALGMSVANPKYLYAALPGSVKLSTNVKINNKTQPDWNDITGNLPVSAAQISDVKVSAVDAANAWVSFSGYAAGNKLFKTSDAGKTWTNISGTLPNVPVNCIAYHNNGKDGLYVGTDIGVFYKDKTMNDWIPFRNGLPTVIIKDLEITGDKIRAATYGRSIWESDLYGDCNYGYSLSGDESGYQLYQAYSLITSTANIKGGTGTQVQYKAGHNIVLNPGFKVDPGNSFVASIGNDCLTRTKPQQRKYRGIYEGVMPAVLNGKKARK